MAQGSNIGMMEGAFFVGKRELLDWVNGLLQVNLTKVEQCANGAPYIQIMDAIFPGTVQMAKVNWMAKSEYEFVNNYKILQQAFDRNQIQKHIDVEKLIRAKYQDNLEFLQWMKRFYDLNCRGDDYPAVERRRGAKTPWDAGDRRASDAPTVKPKPSPAEIKTKSHTSGPSHPTPKAKTAPVAAQPSPELQKQVDELRMTTFTLEKERDFYFGKLRAIELLCEQYPDKDNSTIKEIQKILFAGDDMEVTVNPDGTVSLTPCEEEAEA